MSTRYNRRRFLATATQAVAGAVLVNGTSPLRAATNQPSTDPDKLILIDAHTHFYDPTRPQGVPWPPRNQKQLYRQALPKDYLAQPTALPATGTVVMEASPWVEDNQWVLDLAAQEPFIVGLVGNLPIGTEEFAGHLKRFAANPLFRGIRLRNRKLAGTLDNPAFVSDLKLLADHDLSLDLVGGTEILAYADRLTQATPGLRIIIDHLAGLNVDGQAPSPDWLKQMQALTRHPNIFFKLSGLVEGTKRNNGAAPRDPEFYRPVLDALCQMFSPERLIYASNWPVSELYAPLATVQGIVTEYFHSRGRRVEEQIFRQSSKAVYKWEQRGKFRQ